MVSNAGGASRNRRTRAPNPTSSIGRMLDALPLVAVGDGPVPTCLGSGDGRGRLSGPDSPAAPCAAPLRVGPSGVRPSGIPPPGAITPGAELCPAGGLDTAGAATALAVRELRARRALPSPVGVPALRDTPTPPYPSPLVGGTR